MDVILQFMDLKLLALLAGGVVGGTLVGALPGLTASMGIAIMIPMTFGLPAVTGLVMLIGIYFGAIYGGCISAILVKTPGTPSSAATVLDGYPLAQKGQAGKALGMATVASFVGGLFSAVVLIFLAPQLARVALNFGPAEYFSLAVFGLTIIASLSKDILKGVMTGCLGLMFSTVGADPLTGIYRFTFGMVGFSEGIAFIPALIGLFAISEVFIQAEKSMQGEMVTRTISGLLPTMREFKESFRTMIRGSVIGTFIGIIPGTGSAISSWISYNEAMRASKTSEKFGTGHLEGVAASESANNAVTGGALIPLLALGIPGDAPTAVLIGGILIQGLVPGPMLFKEQPELIQGIFVGSIIANIFMLIFGLLCVKLYAKVLNTPQKILTLAIILFCFMGSYSINGNVFDLYTMLAFGLLGYILQKNGFSLPALCIAMILGPIAERNLRLALVMSDDSPLIFLTSPISAIFLGIAFLSAIWPLVRRWRDGRKQNPC